MEKELGKFKEGVKLPDDLEAKVIEQPVNALYLVLPQSYSDELFDEAFSLVAGSVVCRLPLI
jgi:hypothetical protein